jgi:serine/threonine-protein kinase RsbW
VPFFAGDASDRRKTMSRLPNVRLDLSNRAENVLLIREALTGVAEVVGLDGNDLSDIRTAVTEAANNVVLHAYPDGEGPLQVEIELTGETLEVLVRDHGIGIEASQAKAQGEPGIGLPVMEALASKLDMDEPSSGGTDVRMTFATPATDGLEPPAADEVQTPALEAGGASTATISIAPTELARAIVPRLLCVLAARAHFSTDRISDSQLLADALVAHASDSISGSYLRMAVNVEPRDLEVRVGPLISGRAERLVVDSDVEGLGRVLEKLADAHAVTESASHDLLTLQLLDHQ